MPSLKASKQGREKIKQARNQKGWTVDDHRWLEEASKVLGTNWEATERFAEGISEGTWSRFRLGKPINTNGFKAYCQVLGLNWEEVADRNSTQETASYIQFSVYDDDWVDRGTLINELSNMVRGDCRVLLLVGITGIGKTALAERLIEELRGDWREDRENFEDENKASDFASVALKWLEKWGEPLPQEERKPQQLLRRLVKRLFEHRHLILMDSLEKLLTGSAETEWSDFTDEWWGKFFVSLLAQPFCESRLIVTSQDFPVKLEQECSRYKNLWHHELLRGLKPPQQKALFQKTGLEVSPHSPLLLIGEVYDGHPLALRVIAGEIVSSFHQSVEAYWKKYRHKIEEVKNALESARKEGKVKGEEDRWQLDSYTKALDREVKKRLEDTFERLKNDANDAYFLLCTASVYRCAVAENWWLSHLECRGYEQQKCEDALQVLRDRYLVEDRGINHEQELLVGQHNLIRSVAIDHRLKLFPGN